MKPKKSAAPLQAECAEQRPKVAQVGGVTRVLCNSASNCCIPLHSPNVPSLFAPPQKDVRHPACLLVTPLSFSNAHFYSTCATSETRGRERPGGRTGGHLSESAASLAQPTRRRPPPPVCFLLQTLTPGTPRSFHSRPYILCIDKSGNLQNSEDCRDMLQLLSMGAGGVQCE